MKAPGQRGNADADNFTIAVDITITIVVVLARVYPVHPCADVFPMMTDAEIDALAADIKEHGLRQPILLMRRRSLKPPFVVVDGRNRLEALARQGVEFDKDPYSTDVRTAPDVMCAFEFLEPMADPAAFVISVNIRRRHLTKEQQAELIVKTIAAGQEATTDRAKVARSANGQLRGSMKDPVLAKAVTEAAKHGISKRTVQNARAKLQGKKPAPRASVVKPSQSPLAYSVPDASIRILDVVHTEWKACPSQHRDLLLTVLFKGVQRFAETHNAQVVKAAGRVS